MDKTMYRKQMKFQRAVCYLLLIASALVFVYSLGLVTDLYDALYGTMRNPNRPELDKVPGARIFYEIQPFNSALTTASLILLACSVILFITNSHSRRKYYLANYISVGLSSVANVAVSVWAIINVLKFRTQFLTTVDFEALKEYSEKWDSYYTESTFWFDIAFVVFGLLIIATVLSIINAIWKSQMMKEEKQLIREGLEGAQV